MSRIAAHEAPFDREVTEVLEAMMPSGAPPIALFRTFARNLPMARAMYEWGVHVAFFADRVGLTAAQITSLTHGTPNDSCWTDPAEQALLALVDALHDTADVDDATWAAGAARFDDAQLLDVCLLTGWYHAISFAANAARVPLEAGTPCIGDVVEQRELPPLGDTGKALIVRMGG